GPTVLPDSGAPPSTVVVPKITTTTVSRGDSLWRLSQLSYGAGTRYAVIYKANRAQIRNPNLIYPGQVFVLPARWRAGRIDLRSSKTTRLGRHCEEPTGRTTLPRSAVRPSRP